MSVNYAAGLSDYAHKGKCGQQEYHDTDEELSDKINQLTDIIKNSKHCVVLTGAGISTSTGIPDFRGPKGVWTLEEKGVTPNFTTTFEDAIASPGHMSLVALEKAGLVKYLITQNVDGLHVRSGFPRDKTSILHGDMFVEQCDKCGHQYIRQQCVKTMGLKITGGGGCGKKAKRGNGCRGRLRDTILDWEDSLPDDELEKAFDQCKMADVCLVLGSSLQIVPAGNLPRQTQKNSGKFISVNLQRTKHHKKTDLVIHSKIDMVMERLCEGLGVTIPRYTKPTPVLYSSHTDIKGCTPLNISLHQEWSDPSISKSAKESQNSIENIIPNVKSNDLKRENHSPIPSCSPLKKEAKQDGPSERLASQATFS